MRKLILSLQLCLFLSLLPHAKAEIVYRPDEGWNAEKPGDETPAAKTAQEQLDRAQAFETAGDLPKAIAAYRVFVKKFSFSSHVADAQWQIAVLSDRIADYERAFDAYEIYIKKYPRGENFDKAVEAQFIIAKRYLDGEKVKLYGIKT